MITPAERVAGNRKQLEREIHACEEAMKYAEVYERLLENADFKKHLARMAGFVKYHKAEVEAGATLLVSKHGADRELISDLLIENQIRANQAQEWVDEPQAIVELAKEARERLPELQQQLKDLDNSNT